MFAISVLGRDLNKLNGFPALVIVPYQGDEVITERGIEKLETVIETEPAARELALA